MKQNHSGINSCCGMRFHKVEVDLEKLQFPEIPDKKVPGSLRGLFI
jgi:hypothetical protein